jgi:hypothetical protein
MTEMNRDNQEKKVSQYFIELQESAKKGGMGNAQLATVNANDRKKEYQSIVKKKAESGDKNYIKQYSQFLFKAGDLKASFIFASKIPADSEMADLRASILIKSSEVRLSLDTSPFLELSKAYNEKEANLHLSEILYQNYLKSTSLSIEFDESYFYQYFFEYAASNACLLSQFNSSQKLFNPNFNKAAEYQSQCSKNTGNYEPLATIYVQLNKYRDALNIYKNLEFDSCEKGNLLSKYNLSIIYKNQKDKKGSDHCLDEAIKFCENNQEKCNHFIVAQIYYNENKYQNISKALAYYQYSCEKSNDFLSCYALYSHYIADAHTESYMKYLELSNEFGHYKATKDLGDHFFYKAIGEHNYSHATKKTEDNWFSAVSNFFSGKKEIKDNSFDLMLSYYKMYTKINNTTTDLEYKFGIFCYLHKQNSSVVDEFCNLNHMGEAFNGGDHRAIIFSVNTRLSHEGDKNIETILSDLQGVVSNNSLACYIYSQFSFDFELKNTHMPNCLDNIIEERYFLNYAKSLMSCKEKGYTKDLKETLQKILLQKAKLFDNMNKDDAFLYNLFKDNYHDTEEISMQVQKCLGDIYSLGFYEAGLQEKDISKALEYYSEAGITLGDEYSLTRYNELSQQMEDL